MTVIYDQDFEGLSNASLNGQDSWSGDSIFNVQDDFAIEGLKSVRVSSPPSDQSIHRDVTPIVAGTFSILVRQTSASGGARLHFMFGDGSTNAIHIRARGNATEWSAYSASSIVDLGVTVVADTIYLFTIEFDCVEGEYRVKIDNGDYSSWLPFENSVTPDDLNRITLFLENGPYSGYWDAIVIDEPEPTTDYQISGTVTLSGSPVENATIRCIRQSDNVAIAEQLTDSSGEYLFDELEETELYHLAVEYEAESIKYNAKSLWDISPIEVEL